MVYVFVREEVKRKPCFKEACLANVLGTLFNSARRGWII